MRASSPVKFRIAHPRRDPESTSSDFARSQEEPRAKANVDVSWVPESLKGLLTSVTTVLGLPMQDGSGLADSAGAGVYGDQNGSLDDQLTERGNNLIMGEELVSKQSCESKGKQWIMLYGVSPYIRDMASFEKGLLFSKAADLVFKKP
ncbi:hypothetical protein ACOSQ3_025306 [Xanthoceras sorbifolium]